MVVPVVVDPLEPLAELINFNVCAAASYCKLANVNMLWPLSPILHDPGTMTRPRLLIVISTPTSAGPEPLTQEPAKLEFGSTVPLPFVPHRAVSVLLVPFVYSNEVIGCVRKPVGTVIKTIMTITSVIRMNVITERITIDLIRAGSIFVPVSLVPGSLFLAI